MLCRWWYWWLLVVMVAVHLVRKIRYGALPHPTGQPPNPSTRALERLCCAFGALLHCTAKLSCKQQNKKREIKTTQKKTLLK